MLPHRQDLRDLHDQAKSYHILLEDITPLKPPPAYLW